MPPKKDSGDSPKKEKKEKPADDGGGRAAAMTSVEVEALKSRLGETRARLEQVMAESNAMQQQQLAREQDTFEVVAFLRAENDTLQERLKHFEGEVSRAKRDAENEKQRVNAARDERIKEIETQTQLEMEAKDAEVAALQARLKKVTLFEEQQRKLEEERERLRQEVFDQNLAHKEAFAALERKLIEEKARLQKEAENQVRAIAEKGEEEVYKKLDATTKRILIQNRKLSEDLKAHIVENDKLCSDKLKLEAEVTKLRLDLELHKQSVAEYAKHSFRQSQEIKEQAGKVRNLERSLGTVVKDFERERNRVLSSHANFTEDLELENKGLRSVLKVKELEHRKVKRLAGEILGQRGDVEAFFLQALDEVRSRVAAERAVVRSSSSDSTFLTQADSYGIKSGLRFPGIAGGSHVLQQSRGDDGAGEERVDVGDLSWADKERVLRLLFAKINQAQAKKVQLATPRPPASQRVDMSQHWHTRPDALRPGEGDGRRPKTPVLPEME